MKKTYLYIMAIYATTIFSSGCNENDDDYNSGGDSSGSSVLVDPSNCWYRDSINSQTAHPDVLFIFYYVKSGPQKNHFHIERITNNVCNIQSGITGYGVGSSDGPGSISYTFGSSTFYGIIKDTSFIQANGTPISKQMKVKNSLGTIIGVYYSN